MTIQRSLLLRSFAQFAFERLTDIPHQDYSAVGIFALITTLFFSESAAWDMAQQVAETLFDNYFGKSFNNEVN